mmetsp:Transcript_36189/g.78060  ORF Transcript_36189/g.78060 Transcript_36189/m.78060 type:complete len:241 (+) Transcript_36189:22-744(+)
MQSLINATPRGDTIVPQHHHHHPTSITVNAKNKRVTTRVDNPPGRIRGKQQRRKKRQQQQQHRQSRGTSRARDYCDEKRAEESDQENGLVHFDESTIDTSFNYFFPINKTNKEDEHSVELTIDTTSDESIDATIDTSFTPTNNNNKEDDDEHSIETSIGDGNSSNPLAACCAVCPFSLQDIITEVEGTLDDTVESIRQVVYAFSISPDNIDCIADTIRDAKHEIIDNELERRWSVLFASP